MFSSKISCLLVFSLAFLLGALLVMPSQGQTWAAFRNKHIENPNLYPPQRTNVYCDTQMRRRGMTRTRCKAHNTFIFEDTATVQQICHNIVGPAATPSPGRLNLTDCFYTGGNPPNSCNYRGNLLNRQIEVTCEYSLPVHFIRYI